MNIIITWIKNCKIIKEIILKNNLVSRVLVISFDIDLIQEIKKLDPDIKVGFLFKKYSKKIWNFVESIPLDYICPKYSIVNEKIVKKAHGLGAKVYAYDVNEKKVGDYLIELGVDKIGTDFPKLFI